jgi:hypothetical protein
VARLVLPVLAYASHGSDRGNCQEHESSNFQPELVQNSPKRARGRADPGQHRAAHPAALEQLDGNTEGPPDFSSCLADRQTMNPSLAIAGRHQSILAAGKGTMAISGITVTVMFPVSGVRFEGGLVDQQLKQLMKELGEAINGSLSDSEQIAEVVSRIKEGGYDIFLVLEATIGVSKQGERTSDKTSLVSTLSTNSELKISDQDLKFLKSLRIKIDDADEE